MPQPTNSTLMRDIHPTLHNEHVNVKAFGATGDGVTNDTAALQAAIDFASASGGIGDVVIPSGNYQISSTLTLEGNGIRLRGALGNRQAEEGNPGTHIAGTLNGPLIERATNGLPDPHVGVFIEDLTLTNFHATGTGIRLGGLQGGGVYRCNIRANSGVTFTDNTTDSVVSQCFLNGLGQANLGIGVTVQDHTHVFATDITNFWKGISEEGIGSTITGGRFEVNTYGIYCTGDMRGTVAGSSFEANDTGLFISGTVGSSFTGLSIHGSVGSPSGGSLVGIDIGEMGAITIAGVIEVGSHATGFVRFSNTVNRFGITLLDVFSTTPWVIGGGKTGITSIGCTPEPDMVRAPVIARASLPAAGAGEDGRLIIDDNGAGDRNLMIYAGGQRFRIDGGANV